MSAASVSRFVRLVFALLLAAMVFPATADQTAAGTTGSLAIYKKDMGTARLPGSCFAIFYDAGNGQRGGYAGFQQCDRYDASPDDGILVFSALPPGNYVAVETRAPAGYKVGADKPFAITADKRTNISVRNRPGGSRAIVSKVDANGNLIPGACFDVYKDLGNGQFGQFVIGACDAYDGANGRTVLYGLSIGNYLLYESVVPPGYVRGRETPFSVTSDSSTVRISVTNPPFRVVKSVTVNKVDPGGNPVLNACFQLHFPFANPNATGGFDVGDYAGYFECDGSDGFVDGATVFSEVRANTYVLLEVIVPQGYEVAPIQRFTKSRTSASVLTVVDDPGGSTLRVAARKPSGSLLKGACFSVNRNAGGAFGEFVFAACDDEDGALDGRTHISHLPAGNYYLSEFRTPPGYARPDALAFSIGADTTATVNVTHQPLGAAQPAEAPSPTAVASPSASAEVTPTAAAPVETPTAVPTTIPEPTPVPTEVPTEVATEAPPPEPTPAESAPTDGTTDAAPPAEPTPEAATTG